MNPKYFFLFFFFGIMVFSFAFLMQAIFGGKSMQIVGLAYMFSGIAQLFFQFVFRRIKK